MCQWLATFVSSVSNQSLWACVFQMCLVQQLFVLFPVAITPCYYKYSKGVFPKFMAVMFVFISRLSPSLSSSCSKIHPTSHASKPLALGQNLWFQRLGRHLLVLKSHFTHKDGHAVSTYHTRSKPPAPGAQHQRSSLRVLAQMPSLFRSPWGWWHFPSDKYTFLWIFTS